MLKIGREEKGVLFLIVLLGDRISINIEGEEFLELSQIDHLERASTVTLVLETVSKNGPLMWLI